MEVALGCRVVLSNVLACGACICMCPQLFPWAQNHMESPRPLSLCSCLWGPIKGLLVKSTDPPPKLCPLLRNSALLLCCPVSPPFWMGGLLFPFEDLPKAKITIPTACHINKRRFIGFIRRYIVQKRQKHKVNFRSSGLNSCPVRSSEAVILVAP